jgi:hypothetical protein
MEEHFSCQVDGPFLPPGGGAAEAQRLAQEGLLRQVLPGVYVSVGQPDSVGTRAACVALLLPERLVRAGAVVAEEAAAWVLVGGPAPDNVAVYVPARRTQRASGLIRVHETRLTDSDVEQVGPLRVTTSGRTAADVARRLPFDAALPLLARLREIANVQPAAVLARLDQMHRCRGVPRGRATVQRWSVSLSASAP